jgi:cell division protein FtsZ
MTITLNVPQPEQQLRPRITVIGVGGAGGNAVNNMIRAKLEGVEFVVANTDAQALTGSLAERKIQLGVNITHGLGAGARPDVGRAAAEEAMEEIGQHLAGSHMAFIAAGMGGGTGTGAAPVIARAAREMGVLTVGIVTKPFQFEGSQRAKMAEAGIAEMQQYVDTLIIIPNQNLFRIANEKTTFADAFAMADDVLHSGVRGVTDLMVVPGLINLDFADIRNVMTEMGKAMMGTGEAEGENRAREAAEAAISNPLLDDVSMKGARGVLINITGGPDLTLYEVDEAANRIGEEVDDNANIIFGSTLDPALEGRMRVSVVATGIEADQAVQPKPVLTVVQNPAPRPMATPRPAPSPAPAATMTSAFAPMPRPMAAPAAAAMAATMSAPAPMPAPMPEPVMEMAAPAPVEAEPALPIVEAAVQSPMAEDAARAVETARAEAAPEAFIPPAPVEVSAPAPESRGFAAPVTPRPAPSRNRVSSLLSRIRGNEEKVQAVKPAPAPIPAARQAEPAKAAEPEQASLGLGGLDASERIRGSQTEEDLLEIPAFLRRQAN